MQLRRADAEACLAAIPKAKQFDALAKTHETLVPKCRAAEADAIFAKGRLAELNAGRTTDAATIRQLAGDLAIARAREAERWAPWIHWAIGAGAVVVAALVVERATPWSLFD